MTGLFFNLLDSQTEKDRFIELYDTYKDLLYWIALNKTNNTDDAEECVQETFLYIARHFNKISDINSKDTKSFLSTIVTGFAVDMYNESLKISTVMFEDDNDLEYFENFEKVELLSAFDEVLDEKSKVFLYLKYIYGYKSREIAEIYKIKDSYVRKKIQLAKEKMKKYFEEGN